MIKVSIVIPVYNVEKYLEECLESAVKQKFDSFEIIAVNDGSTDNSLNILESYAKKYEFFKIINQVNKGLSGARNTGLKNAKGMYVYFLDSDDFIDLNTIKYSYNEAINADLDILCFDAESFIDKEFIDVKIQQNYDRKHKLSKVVKSGCDFLEETLNENVYRAPIWLNFYKKSFLDENKLLFAEGYLHEDEIFTIDAYILARKMKYVDKKFFHRRVRENSITTTGITEKHILGKLRAAENVIRYLNSEQIDINNHLRYLLEKHAANFYYWILVDCYILQLEGKDMSKIHKTIQNDINKNKYLLSIKLYLQMNFPKVCYYLRKVKKRRDDKDI